MSSAIICRETGVHTWERRSMPRHLIGSSSAPRLELSTPGAREKVSFQIARRPPQSLDLLAAVLGVPASGRELLWTIPTRCGASAQPCRGSFAPLSDCRRCSSHDQHDYRIPVECRGKPGHRTSPNTLTQDAILASAACSYGTFNSCAN